MRDGSKEFGGKRIARAAWVGCWVLALAGSGSWAQQKAPRAGAGNLVLAEKEGKLVGSFTYQLIVGHFFEWNTDPTAVPGVLGELARRTGVKAEVEFKAVAIDAPQLVRNPLLLLTGNRAFFLGESEQRNVREYLRNGGFLYVDDCGGADWSLRRMLKQVLPGARIEELPADHAILRRPYKLDAVPKVVDLYHGKAKAFGVKLNGRLAAVYTHDTDLPCAWERYPDGSYVHVIPPGKREAAVRFGVNLLDFALRQHLGRAEAPAGAKSPSSLPAPGRLPQGAVRNDPMRRQLASSTITAMAADERYVWFGGFTFLPGEDEGLARYDKRQWRWRVFMDAEGILSEEINCLVVDRGKVLVGADTWKWTKGMAVFDPSTGKWRTINTRDGLPHNRVVAIARDGEDLWLACRQGLAVLRGGKTPAEVIRTDVMPKGGGFMIGVIADGRYVWANHFKGVARYDKKLNRWEKVSDLTPLIGQHALDMANGGGATWFLAPHAKGTRLVRFNGAFAEWPAARTVDLRAACSVAADDREVFVGTRDQGLYVFPIGGGPPVHHASPDPLPRGAVIKVLPDGEHVWASVYPHGGLWRLTRGRDLWKRIPHRRGTPAGHVLSMARVGEKLYVGTLAAGPWAMDLKGQTWHNLNLELTRGGRRTNYRSQRVKIHWDNIYAVLPIGGRIWMGTNHGLIVHDPARTPNGFAIVGPEGLVCKGLAAADGMIWTASAGGEVLGFDPNQVKPGPVRKWSVPGAVHAMCVAGGAFYVATDQGLYRGPVAGGKPTVALADAEIYGLWPAAKGGVWMASKIGLYAPAADGKKPAPIPGSADWGRINTVVTVEGSVLVGGSSGLIVCGPGGRVRAFYNASSGLGADGIGAIAADPQRQQIWLGTLGAGMARLSASALRRE